MVNYDNRFGTLPCPVFGSDAAKAYSVVSQRGWSKESEAVSRLFERQVTKDKVNFILALYKEEKEALQVLADAAEVSMTELVMNALEKTYGHFDIPELKREAAEKRLKERGADQSNNRGHHHDGTVLRPSDIPSSNPSLHEETRSIAPPVSSGTKSTLAPTGSTERHPGFAAGSIISRRRG